MKCKIVSDSASNLLKVDGVEYESVPLKIISGNKEFVDDIHLDLPKMIEEMEPVSYTHLTLPTMAVV